MLNSGFNPKQSLVYADQWENYVAGLVNQERNLHSTDRAMLPLVEHVERLTLLCEAMWALISEKTNLSQDDLSKKMTELDLEDGVLDHKHNKPPMDCPECGNKICRKFGRCLFFGYNPENTSAFETI